jgi:hypothetical protein
MKLKKMLEVMLATDDMTAMAVFVFLDHALMWTKDATTAMKITSEVHTSLYLNQRKESTTSKVIFGPNRKST